MNLHEPTLFAALRKAPFRGRMSQGQVDGVKLILSAAEQERVKDPRQVAYTLATGYHETGGKMAAVRETFAKSDKQAIANLDKAFKSGRLKVSKPYWRDGFFGRGLVQLTWESNYAKMGKALGVDLVGNPSLALDPVISARVLVAGMRDGLFTGKKLSDYFSATKDDPVNARRIVNGTDKAALIAGYHKQFLAALLAAQAAAPVPRPKGATERIQPVPVPQPPVTTTTPPPASQSWAARLLRRLGLSPEPQAITVQPIPSGYSETVERVQRQLQALGYAEVGIADGLYGDKTRDMIKAFSADNGIPDASGRITDAFLAALPKAKRRPVSEQRANTTAKDLRQAGNEPAKSLNGLGWLGNLIGLGGVVGAVNETGVFDSIKNAADTATGTISTIQTALVSIINAVQWVIAHWWLFAIIAGVWMIYRVAKGVLELVVLFRQGILQRASSSVTPVA